MGGGYCASAFGHVRARDLFGTRNTQGVCSVLAHKRFERGRGCKEEKASGETEVQRVATRDDCDDAGQSRGAEDVRVCVSTIARGRWILADWRDELDVAVWSGAQPGVGRGAEDSNLGQSLEWLLMSTKRLSRARATTRAQPGKALSTSRYLNCPAAAQPSTRSQPDSNVWASELASVTRTDETGAREMKGWRSRPPAAHSSHCHRNAGWCWGTNGAVHGARFWADGWVDGWMDGWMGGWRPSAQCRCGPMVCSTQGRSRRHARSLAPHAAHAAAGRSNEMAALSGVAGNPVYTVAESSDSDSTFNDGIAHRPAPLTRALTLLALLALLGSLARSQPVPGRGCT
ncbi:hypothetical protein COCCADRAFT_25017 [Bipolaris zeicola 26-R-13]|uniref:Uncharacterized protein n=1 Tax=Cochliobolus carbonum (strain 26-R-13) TaxID=930089 RepID=W6Y5U5_COCC2|nr:uncharacterized protein COCCADRAFT_25017 [Bipolaris zeicola 26-R-13]EUC34902.1 hypothetical protein COCCADRAFT_25017 [Bipolaris zeicola 26-R-13]